MPSNLGNPPLPPKRTGILPFQGKYLCCKNLPLHALEIVKEHLDKEVSFAQNIIEFLEWAKHYFDCTPPHINYREMNIDAVTWFIRVKELKSRRERFFFPELGSTPITGIKYSFLEVAVEDLTFPNKEIHKCVTEEFICPWPRSKKFKVGGCVEHSAPVGLKKGRAFEISAWEREDKKTECVVPVEDIEDKKPECVVPKLTTPDDSDHANNEDMTEQLRQMDLKTLKEMLVVSDKAEKERAAKEKKAAKKEKRRSQEMEMKSEQL
jgi:hypothetical protein